MMKWYLRLNDNTSKCLRTCLYLKFINLNPNICKKLKYIHFTIMNTVHFENKLLLSIYIYINLVTLGLLNNNKKWKAIKNKLTRLVHYDVRSQFYVDLMSLTSSLSPPNIIFVTKTKMMLDFHFNLTHHNIFFMF